MSTRGFTWDPAGQMLTYSEGGSLVATYKYDPFGRRIEAIPASGSPTYYLYGANDGAHPIAEYTSSWQSNVIAGGAVIATVDESSGNPTYLALDALNSTKQTVNHSGSAGTIGSQYPYGEDNVSTGAEYSYTNQMRDPNGLDHFWMRTYASNLGRWLTPDPAGSSVVDPDNPQTWNRYGYVENSPTGALDLSGLCDAVIGGSTQAAGTPQVAEQVAFADSIGADSAFPFAHLDFAESVANIQSAAWGDQNASVAAASSAIADAAAQSSGSFTIYTWSGGAQVAESALSGMSGDVQNRAYIVALSPGVGLLGFGPGRLDTVLDGGNSWDNLVAASAELSGVYSNVGFRAGCEHNANCVFSNESGFLAEFSSGACGVPKTFSLSPGPGGEEGGSASGNGGGAGGRTNVSWMLRAFMSWMGSITIEVVTHRIRVMQ